MVDISSQWSKQFAPSSIACSRVEKMGGNVITFLSQQLFLKTFVVYFKGFYFMFLNHSSTWQYVVSNMHIFFLCFMCFYTQQPSFNVFRTIGSMAFTQLTFGFSLVHYFIHQILTHAYFFAWWWKEWKVNDVFNISSYLLWMFALWCSRILIIILQTN